MKSLLSVALFSLLTVSVNAMGWVYMEFYPYLYDFDSEGWTYSSEEVLWQYDLATGQWFAIGTPKPQYAPESIAGLKITCCEDASCWEGFQHGYYFFPENEGEYFYFAAMLGGLVPEASRDVKYHYQFLGENEAVLTVVPVGSEGYVESLELEFTDPNSGNFTGAIFAQNDYQLVVDEHWFGTFEFATVFVFLGDEFILSFDQEVTVFNEDLKIHFLEFIDSRCPEGSACFWAGNLVVTLMVNDQELELSIGEQSEPSKVVDGYRITLTEIVSPVPLRRDSESSEYVIKLLVEKES